MNSLSALLRYSLVCSVLCIVPVFLVGFGHMTSLGMALFFILSLLVPLSLRKQKQFRQAYHFRWHSWTYVYSWAFWSSFLALGGVILPIPLSKTWILVVPFIWGLVTTMMIFSMVITTFGLVKLSEWANKENIIESTLEIGAYTLPLPLLILGDILYLNVSDPAIGAYISSTVFAMLQLIIYVLVMVMMGALAFYFYPRGEKPKSIRLLRIIVMAGLWLAIHGHILYGYVPDWSLGLIYVLLPVFQENALVYITPILFEIVTLGIVIFLGQKLEDCLNKVN